MNNANLRSQWESHQRLLSRTQKSLTKAIEPYHRLLLEVLMAHKAETDWQKQEWANLDRRISDLLRDEDNRRKRLMNGL